MPKKITLENGLRLILIPQEGSLAVTALVLVEAGSKYETREINGISHFLEHMVFKGTSKRPTALAIASELDGIGAIYNAFTGSEYTGYYVKARTGHFENILDVLSDIYLHPLFDSQEIDKEKGVIVEEINLMEDQPMRRVWDVFQALMYGDQPAGWRIVGTRESVQKINRDNFLKYRQEHYAPQATTVVIAGGFDEAAAVGSVKKYFGDMNRHEKISKPKVTEEQNSPMISIKYKDTDQSHMILGFRAFDVFDERKYALDVLADILGGSMSSRLFQKIREEMGAVYYVRAGSDLSTDHGYLAISAGVGNDKLDSVILAIIAELKKITEDPPGEEEVKAAKEHIVGNMVLELETSDQLAGFYGDQEITTKEIKSPEEIIKKIEEVTAADILAVAKDIFQEKKMNLALIGPLKEEDTVRFEGMMKL